jgi:16S rRNA (cytosine967-C5)-methyltransferase
MLEQQRLAASVVEGVLAGHSLDAGLARLWRREPRLTARERAMVQDLSYGTLRWLGRLEAVLEALLDKPVEDARLRALLLVALYQLDGTRAAAHAVVDHAVRACAALRLASAKGLVNAVLRNFLRRRPALEARLRHNEVARYSHPQWWIDRLRARYPAHYASILQAGNARPPLVLRVNRRRMSADGYLRMLAEQGLAGERCGEVAVRLAKPVPVARIPGFAEGIVSVQDAAAQLAAPLLDLRDGQRVLDACAAPGGKSGHALELAEVELTALDRDGERLGRVGENLARLGFKARIVQGDAREPRAWWNGQPFDRILADVPCSASGVARRHPDVKWLRRESDIGRFGEEQSAMLDALWQALAGGGKLLYATCSVFQEENNEQIARFLERHRDATRLALPSVDNDGTLPAGQLLPDARHDGFFYALVQKS